MSHLPRHLALVEVDYKLLQLLRECFWNVHIFVLSRIIQGGFMLTDMWGNRAFDGEVRFKFHLGILEHLPPGTHGRATWCPVRCVADVSKLPIFFTGSAHAELERWLNYLKKGVKCGDQWFFFCQAYTNYTGNAIIRGFTIHLWRLTWNLIMEVWKIPF